MKYSKIAAAGVIAAMTGCGGGGGGSSAPSTQPPVTTAPPAAPTPVTSTGVITGFGSVFVNGSRFEVDGQTIVRVKATETVGDDGALRVGMKVRIQAHEDDDGRVADHIEYDEDLKGPVFDVAPDADDPSIGTFSIVHQLVIVDGNTVFDDDVGDNNNDGAIDIRDLELPSGRVVAEVSGHPIEGGFLGTRIDRINDGDDDHDDLEVEGFVTAVADDSSYFMINDATFLVESGAGGTEFEDGLVADETLVGLFVEVEAELNSDGDYVARSVELEDHDDDDRDGRFEIEGILTSVDTSGDPHIVVIGGVTLEVVDASALEGQVGMLIELKGSFDDDGRLVLTEIEHEVENTVRVHDRVVEKDESEGTVTTRLGVVVTPTEQSRLRDEQGSDDRGDHLTPAEFLARVEADDFLRARGFPTDDGVSWTRVELRSRDEQECRLRGSVESIEGTEAVDFSFVILGVTVDVSQVEDDEFDDGHGLGRDGFFMALDVGDVVQAKSDEAGMGCESGLLTARTVEFEADDDVVGTMPPVDDDDGDDMNDREFVGVPSDVTEDSFMIGGAMVMVVGSTLIDDSMIERALGTEFDGDDRRFDQLPAGITLPDLLPEGLTVEVLTNGDGIALSIEDID